MSKITFFPLGNADSSLIELSNGKVIQIDYADMRDPNDKNDKRIDLKKELNSRVKKDTFDVVCFTHLDNDHIKGSSEYFHLLHAKKYQTEGRKKIAEMWVPASAILEDECEEEDRIIQAEARYRFKEGKGIKVFSRPKKLKDWCKNNGVDFEARRHLIVDAGTVINTFSLTKDGVEFFAQSPFVSHIDGKEIDRNASAITLHLTFNNSKKTEVVFGADITWDVWRDIILVTKNKGNQTRLEWDIFHISHHCSYTALSEEKGKTKTEPDEEIKWMFEEQGRKGGCIVSPSKPIPSGYDDTQPPHKQAANYYSDVVDELEGEFKVTMEHPNENTPKPMVFNILANGGFELEKAVASASVFIGAKEPPRAG
ncbi:hypothetical protein [Haliscomenobacter sp.]|uniref:hypothetical protein n=1 Tax=Haliscomenobacter sp. TaxID=2717303 RepID=UPI003BAA0434